MAGSRCIGSRTGQVYAASSGSSNCARPLGFGRCLVGSDLAVGMRSEPDAFIRRCSSCWRAVHSARLIGSAHQLVSGGGRCRTLSAGIQIRRSDGRRGRGHSPVRSILASRPARCCGPFPTCRAYLLSRSSAAGVSYRSAWSARIVTPSFRQLDSAVPGHQTIWNMRRLSSVSTWQRRSLDGRHAGGSRPARFSASPDLVAPQQSAASHIRCACSSLPAIARRTADVWPVEQYCS